MGGALEEIELHFSRARPEDYQAARAIVARWLPVARELHGDKRVHELEREDAYARYALGDVEGGHADLVRLWQPKPIDGPHRQLEGDVVDTAGKPAVGATVAVATRMFADSIGVVPMFRLHVGDGGLHETATDARVHFVFEQAPVHGVVVAQLGDRRSLPQRIGDHLRLALAPTRTVSGTAALGGLTHTEASIVLLTALGDGFALMAPVRPDSTFTLGGVPTSKVSIAVGVDNQQFGSQLQPSTIPAGTAPVTDLALRIPASGRTLDVLARSTLSMPIDVAQVVVMSGRVHVANVGELNAIIAKGVDVRFARHATGETVPRPALYQLKPGDLWARFTNVATGELTVCTLGLDGDFMDKDAMRKLQAHLDEIEVHCVTVEGDTQVVVAPTAPQKRLE